MLRRHYRTVLVLLVSAILVAVAVGLFVRALPDGDREVREYEAAPACTAAPQGPAECRWTQEFTVSDIYLTKARHDDNTAVLTAADGTRWETSYGSRGPVLNQLDEGDRVTATLWRGRIVEISAHGRTQETDDAPVDLIRHRFTLVLAVVPPGLLVAAACVWRLARRDLPAPTRGMAATLMLACALILVGILAPIWSATGPTASGRWRPSGRSWPPSPSSPPGSAPPTPPGAPRRGRTATADPAAQQTTPRPPGLPPCLFRCDRAVPPPRESASPCPSRGRGGTRDGKHDPRRRRRG